MSTLYHNPRCSKSREALQLLQAAGINPEIRLYLEQPPSATEMRKLLKQLGTDARALLRTGEPEYRERQLADPSLSQADLIEAMCAAPKLIERPIFIHENRACIGRPPETVLQLLEAPHD